MPHKIIAALIGEGLVDKATGKKLTVPMQSVVIESGLAKQAGALLNMLALGKKMAVISDSATHEVLGQTIESAVGNAVSIVLCEPKADMETVTAIRHATQHVDALIAVGAGTINDLCKYASFLDKKPYVLFGTAPSMNGYGSANAAITINGHKKTLAAHLPVAIYLDIDILAAAPVRLIRSGLGDTLCRSTVQADWLLSHLLLGTAYDVLPFSLITPYEKMLCEHAKRLAEGDKELITLLSSVLILSGFGMVLAGGSYPASQGEHMIAHTMEMVHGDALLSSFHGEQIGVTTLTMSSLQEAMLRKLERAHLKNVPLLKERLINDDKILAYYGKEVGVQCINEMEKKHLSPLAITHINEYIAEHGALLVQKLSSVMLPKTVIYHALSDAGSPREAKALGWDAYYEEAVSHAVYSRNRFTFLDMVWYREAN